LEKLEENFSFLIFQTFSFALLFFFFGEVSIDVKKNFMKIIKKKKEKFFLLPLSFKKKKV